MKNGKVIEESEQRSIALSEDERTLLMDYKHVVDLSVADDRNNVTRFAEQCKTHKPALAIIDASKLDGPPRGTDEEDFEPWWLREIVPLYHAAGIAGLAIVIGNPNAPGETADLPPGVNFKRGYFADLASAMAWQPGAAARA